jgi:hypothetical protein
VGNSHYYSLPECRRDISKLIKLQVELIKMKLINIEKILENKYNHLLASEIFIIVAYPFSQSLDIEFPIFWCVFLAALIPALRVLLPLKAFISMMSLGVFGIILRILLHYHILPAGSEKTLITLVDISAVIFLLLAIAILIKRISSREVITSDTVKGGISVYFLIGVVWTYVYVVVLRFNPIAFSHVRNESVDCFYYSFATLTTLGPGDITPVTTGAKFLAILEAFTGQLYLAIFIAQLIGLRIGKKLQKN